MEFLKNILGNAPMQETLFPLLVIAALICGVVILLNIVFGRRDADMDALEQPQDKKSSRAANKAKAKNNKTKTKKERKSSRKAKKSYAKTAPVMSSDEMHDNLEVEGGAQAPGESAPAALLQRANMHMAAGDIDKAEQVYLAINKHRPSDMGTVRSLLSIYGERKDVERFSHTYESAMRLLQNSSDTLGEQKQLESIKDQFFNPDGVQQAVAAETSSIDFDQLDEPSFMDMDVPEPSGADLLLTSNEEIAVPTPAAVSSGVKPQYEQTLINRFKNNDFNATVLLLTMYGNRQDQSAFDEVYPVAVEQAETGSNKSDELAQLRQLKERYFSGVTSESAVSSASKAPTAADLDIPNDIDMLSSEDMGEVDMMVLSEVGDIDLSDVEAPSFANDLDEPEFMDLGDDVPDLMANIADDLPSEPSSEAMDAAEEEKLFADFDMLMDNEAIMADFSDEAVVDDILPESDSELPAIDINAAVDETILHREIHHDDPEEELAYLNETRIEFAETMLKADNQLAAMQLFEKVLESGDKRHSEGVKLRIIEMLGG